MTPVPIQVLSPLLSQPTSYLQRHSSDIKDLIHHLQPGKIPNSVARRIFQKVTGLRFVVKWKVCHSPRAPRLAYVSFSVWNFIFTALPLAWCSWGWERGGLCSSLNPIMDYNALEGLELYWAWMDFNAFCIISFEVTCVSQVISRSCLRWMVTVMPLALASLVGRGDEVSDCWRSSSIQWHDVCFSMVLSVI